MFNSFLFERNSICWYVNFHQYLSGCFGHDFRMKGTRTCCSGITTCRECTRTCRKRWKHCKLLVPRYLNRKSGYEGLASLNMGALWYLLCLFVFLTSFLRLRIDWQRANYSFCQFICLSLCRLCPCHLYSAQCLYLVCIFFGSSIVRWHQLWPSYDLHLDFVTSDDREGDMAFHKHTVC